MNERENEKTWEKSPAANIVRYVPSGKYFARVRIGGKLILKSLKTDVFTVAQMRLADLVKERRKDMEGEHRAVKGKMLFADARKSYEAKFEADNRITEGAKIYRRKCVKALLASWPLLDKTNVSKISKDGCVTWAAGFSADYSPSVYNNTVDTLRGILDVAIKCGARYGNPASEITKRKPSVKKLILPSREQFNAMVSTVENAGGRFSQGCADLIRFLAYGGFRITEAGHIAWDDCDFAKGQIHVRITKNGEARHVPMIPEMKQTLQRIRAARLDEPATARVMGVRECQKAMENAAKKIGMARITHHDLRHLFATRCIESGVDIPTVSRWLGHKDGGALAMKVYGHLTNEHSTAMAQKVNFGKLEEKEAA